MFPEKINLFHIVLSRASVEDIETVSDDHVGVYLVERLSFENDSLKSLRKPHVMIMFYSL